MRRTDYYSARARRLRINRFDGRFLGVCAGFANYLGVPAWTLRLAFIAGLFFWFWLLVPAYFIAWMVMDKDNRGLKHCRGYRVE